ncbi:MAG: PD40 domain-containing protein [Bacteroidetes bacterium]|nr:PD40 domain-containing protein [Bacteroidota bacterium]
MRQLLFTFFMLPALLSVTSLGAQASSEKLMIAHGETLFQQREYEQAYGYYNKLRELHPEVVLYQYRTGICAIYRGDPKEALELLKGAYDKDPSLENINFFLGRAYLLNEQFDDALLQFNLQLAKETNEADKQRLQQYVTNTVTAKELIGKPVNTIVINPGRPINSPGDEYAPIITQNDSVIIFTYKGVLSTGGKNYTFGRKDSAGVFFEDIYLSMKSKGSWFTPQSLSNNLNTGGHNATAAITPDGKRMFVFQGSNGDGGDIYVSDKVGFDWSVPQRMPGAINSPYWEGSLAISPDGEYLYFSSTRPGGYGGKDLYRARKDNQGIWSFVENLGPAVNSPLDDDAPSFDPSGNLIFSSRGHNSMGGFDIFIAEKSADGQLFGAPKNMGYPINSTAEDIYYVVTKDGQRAAFSSNRKDGNGGMDIYFTEPGVPAKEGDLVMIKGLVTLDGNPINSVVTVTYTNKTEVQGDYQSNTENGRYLITLPPGENYKLIFTVSGQDEYEQVYDATRIRTFTSNEINVEFYSDEYRLAHPEKFGQMTTADSMKVMENIRQKEMIDKTKNLFAISDSSQFFTNMDQGTTVSPGYYVVIGSFKNRDFAKRLETKVTGKPNYPRVQRVLNRRNGFMYVTIAHPETKEEAIEIVLKAREEYPDAWIQYLK